MKVAINGCGVAGTTLAWWLKYYGFEPVIFEKASALRTGGYLIDLWGPGFEVAEKMDIIPALQKKRYEMESLRVVDSKGRKKAHVDIAAQRRDGVDNRFFSLLRRDITATLFETCDDIDIRFGKSIVNFNETDEKITVMLSDGGKEDFDLLIGADGFHSHIRSLLFGPEKQHLYHLGAHVSAFVTSDYPKRDELTYIIYSNPKKQVERIALRDDKTLFLFPFRSELITKKPKTIEEQKKVLKEIYKDCGWETETILNYLDSSDDFYFDSVSQIRLEKWSRGRVGLVGDAAACTSFLAGEGTGMGMLKSYVLAGELYKAQGNYQQAFDNYEQHLKSFLERKQHSASKMVSFFAPKSRFQKWLIQSIIKISSISFLSKLQLKAALKSNIQVPDYS